MSEKQTKAAVAAVIPTWFWFLFVALTVFVYLFALDLPLLGPDEPRYSQVAREMFERRDWITPTLGGYHWFEKPALLYWIQIVSYHTFGVNEFAARLGSALFGLGTISGIYLLGRVFDDKLPGLSRSLAILTASTIGIIVFARGASFDIIVTFPITAALVAFFIHDRTARILPLALFYFFSGAALLAKGLIGVVFPFAIVFLYLIASRRWPTRTLLYSLVWGALITISVGAVWYLPMYQRHGWEFIDEFFLQHHFQRFTSNRYQHPQPFYFFLWVLPLMTIPWMPFLFMAVFERVRVAYRPEKHVSDMLGPVALFSAIWTAVPLLFFSCSGSKLPGYILPALPGAVVFIGTYLHPRVTCSGRWRNAIAGLAVTTLLVIIGLLIFVVPRFAEADSVRSLIAAGDAKGYAGTRVLMLKGITHNAEFYAAGRLVRDEEGRQRRFGSVEELRGLVGSAGRALVIVPVESKAELSRDPSLRSEFIAENAEVAIFGLSVN